MLVKLVFVICTLLFTLLSPVGLVQVHAGSETTKWVVLESSNLQVNGSTNINQFSCGIPACLQIDTISISRKRNNKEIVLSGKIDLDIKSFDCHNDIMTRDLRKTLREKEFPKLNIRFLSLSELPKLTGNPLPISGQIEIEIAGVKKLFDISYHLSIDNQKVIRLIGERTIAFSDFKLSPPKKLAGLVHTKDELKVLFHLNMKAI